jgi:hypothetical protein
MHCSGFENGRHGFKLQTDRASFGDALCGRAPVIPVICAKLSGGSGRRRIGHEVSLSNHDASCFSFSDGRDTVRTKWQLYDLIAAFRTKPQRRKAVAG